MSFPVRMRRLVCAASLMLTGLVPMASAQTYSNPNLPRSPYTLPEPTGGPDADDLIEGNGRLHSSGQWRHWGDKRNSGETFQELFAPSGALDLGQGAPSGLPRSRFCAAHPDQC